MKNSKKVFQSLFLIYKTLKPMNIELSFYITITINIMGCNVENQENQENQENIQTKNQSQEHALLENGEILEFNPNEEKVKEAKN